MAIKVLCPGCRTLFTVSDKFAGRTGPCPKCKASITIPATSVKEVTIHGPEEEATRAGRPPLAPIVFEEHPIPVAAFVAVGVGAMLAMLLAFVTGRIWPPEQVPAWLLAAAALTVAAPCCWIGYEMVRDRNLAPYRGRALLVRTLICAVAYALLWGVKSFVPPDLTSDMWPWLYIGPPFFFAGSLAALAVYDLDWGTGVAHYSLYVMFTALLRWLAGFMPV
ncbi:MAG: hypothetical protein ACKOTB_11540 [Planctomycetia bacterium]